MSDFINKIVTVIMIFIMLVVAPLLLSYKNDNMLARREILNDVEVFIDKVSDTSTITQDDIDELMLSCNSHGLTVDVDINRLTEVAVYDSTNSVAQTNYISTDDLESLKNINKGDIIQVHIKEMTISSARQATYRILGIDENALEFSLAGVVG